MAKTINKDTVAVVRCEQCKFGTPFFDERGNRMVMCYIHAVGLEAWTVRPEWFCADGESIRQAERDDDGKPKPCPFCGGEALGPTDAWPHTITCEQCGAAVKGFGYDEDGMKEAVEKWNRRASE